MRGKRDGESWLSFVAWLRVGLTILNRGRESLYPDAMVWTLACARIAVVPASVRQMIDDKEDDATIAYCLAWLMKADPAPLKDKSKIPVNPLDQRRTADDGGVLVDYLSQQLIILVN